MSWGHLLNKHLVFEYLRIVGKNSCIVSIFIFTMAKKSLVCISKSFIIICELSCIIYHFHRKRSNTLVT